MITATISRIKAMRGWFLEGRFAIFLLVIIAAALFLAFHLQPTESTIRLTGLVLQLLGILTVAWGISETRALFGHPSFFRKAEAWVKRCPLFRRDQIVGAAASSVGLAVAKARGFGTHGAGADASTETRVEALEKNVASINDRISELYKEMDREFQNLGSSLESEIQRRQTEDESIRSKLEAIGTGGIHITAIGAVLLFLGVILSTASKEMAEWLA